MTFITVFGVATFAGCGKDDKETSAPPGPITGDEVTEDPDTEDKTEDGQDHDDLVIPISSLTTDAKFFGVTVGGTYMEVIAYKYASTYRTAFNTCQVCYGSRTAYFKQSGNYLVCQNCKNKFALSDVGLQTSMYTCSPYPILESDRTVDGDNIIISYEFLVQTRNLFKTWKVT